MLMSSRTSACHLTDSWLALSGPSEIENPLTGIGHPGDMAMAHQHNFHMISHITHRAEIYRLLRRHQTPCGFRICRPPHAMHR